MNAGKAVWHDGGPLEGHPLRVFQLCIALPEQEELGPPESQIIPADSVEEDVAVRVVLGQFGIARSRIRAPKASTLPRQLKDRERWGTRRRAITASHGSLSIKADLSRQRLSRAERSRIRGIERASN